MKKFLSALKRMMPKRLLPVLAVVLAVAVPVAIIAWGPSRAIFTAENPAPHVTFNSITNNPEVGDERNFVTVKDASDANPGNWKNDLNVTPGKDYMVRVYVHNDAAANLNLKATNSRVKVTLPTNTAKEIGISGFISADNATPQEVWADSVLRSTSDFNIAYVDGSARLYNKAFGQTGAQLSDNIVNSTGAQLGFDKLDGVIPGCIEFSGYVTFKIRIQGPSEAKFDFTKDVRKAGSTDKYAKSIESKPGDKVEFRLSYKNNSQVTMNDVLVKDTLPKGLTFVPGTAKMYNANYPYPNGWQVTEALFQGGSNIGAYSPTANALVVFTAQVDANDKLPVCGPNKLRNVASATTDYGTKEDSADVNVPKECQTAEAKVVCKGLEAKTISRTQFTFKGSKEVTNAEFVKYVYVVKNANGDTIKTIESTNDNAVAYENSTVGKYTVQVSVVAKIDGNEVTKTSDACKGAFEVVEKPQESTYKCDSLRLIEVKNRTEATFEAKAIATGGAKVKEYKLDFGDTQSKVFGVGSETQTHTYAPGTYTAKLYVSFEVDGKLVRDVTSEACQATLKIEQPPVVPPTTPEMPKTLPATGPETALAGLVGSSALGFGINAWVRSRKNLAALRK